MSSKVPDCEMRKKLEEELQSCRQDLEIYKIKINLQKPESIRNLYEEKIQKEVELEGCWFYEFFEKRKINNEITKRRKRIAELELLEKKQKEVEKKEEQLKDIVPGEVWAGYPESLNGEVVAEYTEKFKTLSHPLTPKVPFINILMIGETGAGKSSCLNTFASALSGKMEEKYRISPTDGKEKSATQRIHLEPLVLDGRQLPCRFYDMPGLDDVKTLKKDRIIKMINGKLKIDVEIDDDSDGDIVRMFPTLADKIHCILYVIKATADLSSESLSLKLMREIKDAKNSEDGVRQFVIVTAIDKIGVPNSDMKNAYKYNIVKKICQKVSVALDVDLFHVIPVSNYVDEAAPTKEKNAMSLYSLWRVFNSGREYIERKLKNKRDTYDDVRRLLTARD